MYFIGKDGSPLDIIKGSDDLTQFSSRVDNILSKAGIVIESGKVVLFSQWILNL